jgi:NADP-dependent 3-hydroxy acid dehydrogenase YdfG
VSNRSTRPVAVITGASSGMGDRDALLSAADQVRRDLGRVDVLVNNAGMMLLGPFGTEQREEARRMVEVNLLGAMTATEVFLPLLRDGGGDLVNISSVAGRIARAGNAAYAATKWGLPQPITAARGFTFGLRHRDGVSSDGSTRPAPRSAGSGRTPTRR